MEQTEDNFIGISDSVVHLSRKAWTAYLGVAIRGLVLILGASAAIYWQSSHWQIILLLMVIPLALLAYQVLLLRRYLLYYDDVGVWIYSGVLPWKRGVSGVKWRDLDEAIFVNSFLSWVTGAYTIQLRHRFTKVIEITAANMAQGKQAVITINQQQRRLLGSAEAGNITQGEVRS